MYCYVGFQFPGKFLRYYCPGWGEVGRGGGGGGGGGVGRAQGGDRYTSINFLDSAGVLLVVQEKEGEGGKQPRKMMTLSKSLEKSLM